MNRRDHVVGYLFILPAFLLVFVLLLIPMFQNIYYSFFEWDGISEPIFIGLKNYISFFSDENFLVSFRNTLIWVGFTLIFPVMGGLLIAFAGSEAADRGAFEITRLQSASRRD